MPQGLTVKPSDASPCRDDSPFLNTQAGGNLLLGVQSATGTGRKFDGILSACFLGMKLDRQFD